MRIRPLPMSFNFDNGILPPVYGDHFLFVENLSGPYECAEHPSGIGLLMTGQGKCNYYVNGIISSLGDKTQVDMTHIGLVPEAECYGTCEAGWNTHIKGNLLKHLTENAGTPQ